MAELSILAIAESLDAIGLDVAELVVEEARKEFEKPPSGAQLWRVSAQVRADLPQPREALLAPPGIDMPREVLDRVTAMAESFTEPEAESPEIAHKRAVAAVLAGPRSRSYCKGGGQEPVVKNGKPVCPDCGVEVLDIVLTPAPKRRGDGAPFNPKVAKL